MEQSPRLSLSYVMPAQAQKHVTVNETFRRLDALAQLTVRSQTVSAEPASPAEGDAYILPGSPTGSAWAAYTSTNIAVFQDGAWVEIVASEGLRAWDVATGKLIVFDGTVWTEIVGSGGGSSETAAKFGVNTAADSANRLSVKSDAVLFSHDDVTPGTGDSQVKVNKAAIGDTASHLFQTGFSGRAEFGLTGDDDFHIKVSPNGSSWTDAIFVDKDNGLIGLGTASPSAKLHINTGDLCFSNARGIYAEDVGGTAQRLFHIGGDNHCYFNANALGNQIRFHTNNARRGYIHADGGFVIDTPSGGSKGAGTINAEGVYDDNSLLSCYVFDQAIDGTIDIKKWDEKVPDKIIPAESSERRQKTESVRTFKTVINMENGIPIAKREEITIDKPVFSAPIAIVDDDGKPVLEEYEEIIENEEGQRTVVKKLRPKLHRGPIFETVMGTDERVIRREHKPLRKFAARINTPYNPLTLDGYAKHWKEKRHLSAMPNEVTFDSTKGLATGEWIQRLVETVEIQAVLIEQLNQQLKKIRPANNR